MTAGWLNERSGVDTAIDGIDVAADLGANFLGILPTAPRRRQRRDVRNAAQRYRHRYPRDGREARRPPSRWRPCRAIRRDTTLAGGGTGGIRAAVRYRALLCLRRRHRGGRVLRRRRRVRPLHTAVGLREPPRESERWQSRLRQHHDVRRGVHRPRRGCPGLRGHRGSTRRRRLRRAPAGRSRHCRWINAYSRAAEPRVIDDAVCSDRESHRPEKSLAMPSSGLTLCGTFRRRSNRVRYPDRDRRGRLLSRPE